jgi:PhzF family phenazine biosynthesis protein
LRATAHFLLSLNMQHVAASWEGESVFVLDPQQAGAHARLRFYAPKHEMDICVHAMIGAVATLVEQGRLVQSPARIETLSGIITVEWTQEANGTEVTVEQFPPSFGKEHPALDEIAAVLRLPQTAIRLDWGPIQAVSTARAKVIVPLADYRALDSIQPDFEAMWSLCDEYHATGLYPFTLSTRSNAFQIEARQFPNRVGFNEDAATGVAACALGAYLTEHEVLQPKAEGWHRFTIGQGYAVGRPSMLVAETWVENGAITRTRVRGRARLQDRETLAGNAS